MFSSAIISKENPSIYNWLGMTTAMIGIFILFLPEDLVSSQPKMGLMLMLLAAIGWGIYTIGGRSSKNPLITTMSNFIFTLPIIFFNLVIYPDVIKLKKRYEQSKKIELELVEKLGALPKKSLASARLMEVIESDKAVYHSMMQQLMQFEFLLKSNSSDISVIHMAYEPDSPLPQYAKIKIAFLLLISTFILSHLFILSEPALPGTK